MKSRKRAGRPTKPAEAGTKVSLGLKVTADTKSRLEEEASKSGRTQSQEAEFRIERSLDHLRLLPEVLELAYGNELAGVLIAIAAAMNDARLHARIVTDEDYNTWIEDAFAFDAAVTAAQMVFEALRPVGSTKNPASPSTSAEIAQICAERLLQGVVDGHATPSNKNALEARNLLGPAVVKRLKGKRS
jgi:hypothetical protein